MGAHRQRQYAQRQPDQFLGGDMAQGDAKVQLASTPAGSFLDARPTGAEEWSIQDLCGSLNTEIWVSDGTNTARVRAGDGAGTPMFQPGLNLVATFTRYYRLRNAGTTAAKILSY